MYRRKIISFLLLAFPFTGICQQNNFKISEPPAKVKIAGRAPDMGRLSTLDKEMMWDELKKEGLDVKGFERDYELLDSILETDIGEYALADEMGKLEMPKDSLALRQLIVARGGKLYWQKIKMKQAFIARHPDSFVSLYELNDMEQLYSVDSYANAFNTLTERLKSSMMGREIRVRIKQAKLTPTGKVASDFMRKNQFGEMIRLSDYRGKLVLLDFWGSWCVPCRQTHPHLKELYAQYKSKGLEIVAVANEKGNTDIGKQNWLAAIKKDNINWVHVLNNEGSGDPDITIVYGITSYPTKLLLDKNGKILMRVSSGLNDEMDILIKKILGD